MKPFLLTLSLPGFIWRMRMEDVTAASSSFFIPERNTKDPVKSGVEWSGGVLFYSRFVKARERKRKPVRPLSSFKNEITDLHTFPWVTTNHVSERCWQACNSFVHYQVESAKWMYGYGMWCNVISFLSYFSHFFSFIFSTTSPAVLCRLVLSPFSRCWCIEYWCRAGAPGTVNGPLSFNILLKIREGEIWKFY